MLDHFLAMVLCQHLNSLKLQILLEILIYIELMGQLQIVNPLHNNQDWKFWLLYEYHYDLRVLNKLRRKKYIFFNKKIFFYAKRINAKFTYQVNHKSIDRNNDNPHL